MRGQWRYRGAAAVLTLALAGALGPASAGHAATTKIFASTGAEQTFRVPARVKRVHVVAIGAPGGRGAPYNLGGGILNGGLGGLVVADLAVKPRQILYIEVGGAGGNAVGYPTLPNGGAAGFNGGGTGGTSGLGKGGGGGGGASDVRTVPRSLGPASLASRAVIAGGGGGSGGDTFPSVFGGSGGGAGANGEAGTQPGNTPGGQGATVSAGGNGGGNGGFGFLGQGGVGGSQQPTGAGGGGGGGGGVHGGGGGDHGNDGFDAGAGGGGGSSGFGPGASKTLLGLDTSGVPSITLTFKAKCKGKKKGRKGAAVAKKKCKKS